MPVEIRGLVETKHLLRVFTPDLYKEMNRTIRNAMIPIRDKARGFVPAEAPTGLRNWNHDAMSRSEGVKYRPFPLFNASVIRTGIVYSAGVNHANNRGFAVAYYVANRSAAGAIYETAGRLKPHGQEWEPRASAGNHTVSHSLNRKAGQQFIDALPDLVGYRSGRKHQGRLIFKAFAQNQGKVNAVVVHAIENAVSQFNHRRAA